MAYITYLRPVVILWLGIASLWSSPMYSQSSFQDVEKYIVNQLIENKIPGIACCVVKEIIMKPATPMAIL